MGRIAGIRLLFVLALLAGLFAVPRPAAALDESYRCNPELWPGASTGTLDISGLDLSGCTLPDFIDLANAKAVGTNFDNVTAHGLWAIGSDLTGATFRGADLSPSSYGPATFRGSHFDGADFSGAVIPGGVFEYSWFTNVDFSGATLTSARFSGDDLRGAEFTGTAFGTFDWGMGNACPDGWSSVPPGDRCENHLAFVRLDRAAVSGFAFHEVTLTGKAGDPATGRIPTWVEGAGRGPFYGGTLGEATIDPLTGRFTWRLTTSIVGAGTVQMAAWDISAQNFFALDIASSAPVVMAPDSQTHSTVEQGYFNGYQLWELGSFADPVGPDAGPWTVYVGWGDGWGDREYVDQAGSIPALSHIYTSLGAHTVTVEVANAAGTLGSAEFTATLVDPGPEIPIEQGDLAVTEGATGDLMFGIHDQSMLGPWTVDIDYGDGTSTRFATDTYDAPLPQGTHVWAAADPCTSGVNYSCYTATIKVSDRLGAANTITRGVFVLDVAPVVTAEPSIRIPENHSGPLKVLSFTDATNGPWHIYMRDAGSPQPVGDRDWIVDTAGDVFLPDYTGGPIPRVVLDFYVVDRTGLWTVVRIEINGNDAPVVQTPAFDKTPTEGARVVVSADFGDPGMPSGETYTCQIDYGIPGMAPQTKSWAWGSCIGDPVVYQPGTYTVTVTVTDDRGGVGMASTTISVPNLGPAVDAPTLTDPLAEGATVKAIATFSDPGSGETFTCAVDYGDGSGTVAGVVNGSTCTGPGHVYAESGTFTVTVEVGDGSGSGTASSRITIRNVAPTIVALTSAPVRLGSPAMFYVTFSDPGIAERYTVRWTASNGASGISYYVAGLGGVTTGSGGFNPGVAGVYTVTVTVSDGVASATATVEAVVYDPARSLSGKGTVASPAGACKLTTACGVASTATFSVSASYPKGATTPKTSFSFVATAFALSATSGAWLVAAPGSATFQGAATVNGTSGYTFRLTVVDGKPDKAQLQVWNAAGSLVYDTGSPLALASGSLTVK